MSSQSEPEQGKALGAQTGQVLSVTELSQYVFCPRQFYLSKVLQLHRQPPEFVEGTLEHDARRLLNEALCSAYIASQRDTTMLLHEAGNLIGKVLEYAKNIALQQHPIFTKEIDRFVRELSYRFHQEERDRVRILTYNFTGESSWIKRVQALFPVENEFSVFSPRLGLRGRIDEVYERADGTLAIRDIKTAPLGFLFDDSNQIQLGAYTMLLEDQALRRVVAASIYSSRSLAERSVVIDEDLKKRVLDANENVRRFLANPELPKILSGPESVKCDVCFLRKECKKLSDVDKETSGIEALFNSHGKLSLFGDN